MQYIVDDALTSKSFYSTGEGIHSFRLQRFLQKKHNYLLYVKAYFDILKRKHQLQLLDDNQNGIRIEGLTYNELSNDSKLKGRQYLVTLEYRTTDELEYFSAEEPPRKTEEWRRVSSGRSCS
jgi:hypothetical protein